MPVSTQEEERSAIAVRPSSVNLAMVIGASVDDVGDVVAAGSLKKVMLPQRENQQIFENFLSFLSVSFLCLLT
jgi:hypothetical protein